MIKIKQEQWEWIEIEKLKTDGNNPNVMTEKELEALKKNIAKFGFNMPIITDMKYLIADGEQKLTAAKEMGLKRVPVLRKEINDTERRIIRQSMNKLRGTHDLELDSKELKAILEDTDMEELVNLTSISEQEILNLINKSDQDAKEVAEQVEKLGSLTVKCPKCGHKFERGE